MSLLVPPRSKCKVCGFLKGNPNVPGLDPISLNCKDPHNKLLTIEYTCSAQCTVLIKVFSAEDE